MFEVSMHYFQCISAVTKQFLAFPFRKASFDLGNLLMNIIVRILVV